MILSCLQLDIPISKTKEFIKDYSNPEIVDGRELINAKNRKTLTLDTYTQVFESKKGFISNLSILDLLFNEGPNSLMYLENQEIK